MIRREPILFKPIYKQVVWGGDRIGAYKNDPTTPAQTGESWELSAVEGNVSEVKGGPYNHQTLNTLTSIFGPELLGTRVYETYNGHFPLLIKFIDARDDLSVQVHPDDTLAMSRHHSPGKTEMWYIIDSEAGAKIYSGLCEQLTPDQYVERVEKGTFQQAICSHTPGPGDTFFIPAGRVHAIGAGNLLLEIQQSSDVTYRIFDYNRPGTDGKPRQLHTAEARDAIDFTLTNDCAPRHPDPSTTDEVVVECRYFTARRLSINGIKSVNINPESFLIAVCVEGETTVSLPDGEATLKAGTTALLPANSGTAFFDGKGTLLLVTA